ncbi:hypothetical protein [Vreelandella titanicae]|nr:hypothetical protein [Halomonas titanicae]
MERDEATRAIELTLISIIFRWKLTLILAMRDFISIEGVFAVRA